jgi:hypothetical protein
MSVLTSTAIEAPCPVIGYPPAIRLLPDDAIVESLVPIIDTVVVAIHVGNVTIIFVKTGTNRQSALVAALLADPILRLAGKHVKE